MFDRGSVALRWWLALACIVFAVTLGCSCGGGEDGAGGCTVNCGRLGVNIDIRQYTFITEEECREKAEGCRGVYCPPGIASQEECYDV